MGLVGSLSHPQIGTMSGDRDNMTVRLGSHISEMYPEDQ